MINTAQFNIAADVVGVEEIRAIGLSSLSELEALLGSLSTQAQQPISCADTLHAHLSTLAAMGAGRLGTKVADIEIAMREGQALDAQILQDASDMVQTTRSTFLNLTGSTSS